MLNPNDQHREQTFELLPYCSTMGYLIGFLPWIAFAFLSASNSPSRDQLLLASAVAAALAVITTIPSAKKHMVGSIEVGGLIFFPIMFILSLVAPPLTVDKWSSALMSVGLAIAIGAGIVANKPFTLMYAKAAVPEVLWTNPDFIASNKRMSTGWFLGFVVMAISSCVAAFFTPSTMGAYLFAWVIPIGVMVAVVFWQRGEIEKGRAKGAARAHERLDRVIAPGDRVVDFLDHVTARVTKDEAEKMCSALASLGLVQAWRYADYGDFGSGGLRFGDLNIEILGMSDGSPEFMPDEWATFEPISLNGLLPELDRRGISHGDLDTQKAGEMEIYTRIPLTNMQDEHYATQLCTTFGPTRTVQPDAPPNRAGIVTVREVRLNVSPAMNTRWQSLLAPLAPGTGVNFGQGPLVTLLPADKDGVESVVVAVRNVPDAVAALTSAGLTVDGSVLQLGTLRLQLVSQ